jgi:hypothetical protein
MIAINGVLDSYQTGWWHFDDLDGLPLLPQEIFIVDEKYGIVCAYK